MLPLCEAKDAGFPGGKRSGKWQALHDQKRPSGQFPGGEVSADALFLHLPRERDAWQIESAKRFNSAQLTVDLSQSVTRGGARTDGCLPTITPGSVLAVAGAGRVLCPLEKVMLHGFPVHRMRMPPGVTQKQLESMGGNTMHVHVVAVAIRLVLGLVDWGLGAAGAPCPASSTYRAYSPKSAARAQSDKNSKQVAKQKAGGKARAKKTCGALSAALETLKARWGLLGSSSKKRQKKTGRQTLKSKVKKGGATLKTSVLVLKGTRWGWCLGAKGSLIRTVVSFNWNSKPRTLIHIRCWLGVQDA